MRLDPTALRYLSRDDFRVLTAVEMGMKNHDLVPRELITQIAALRHGGSEKILQTLLRHKLLHHETHGFDGYRLTSLGYDFLALRAFTAKGLISGVGSRIGVGKESDIFLVEDDQEREMVIKLHRLGRTSFRAIKNKRDYHGKRGSPSWIYLSRIASQKEFSYMKALYENGFPVPEPIETNRHCILMSLLEGYPLHSVDEMEEADKCMITMLDLISRLAKCGLIHGDFNEFNVAISRENAADVVMYDFPQMVSMNHPNAKMYFDRDVNGVFRFFKLRFGVDVDEIPRPNFEELFAQREKSLDVEIGASGFSQAEYLHFEREMEKERLQTTETAGLDEAENGDEEEEEEFEENEEANDSQEEISHTIKESESTYLGEEIKSSEEEEEEQIQKDKTTRPKREQKSARNHKVQLEVAKLIKRQIQGSKSSRNTIKSREKRKVQESMRDW